MSLEGGFIKEKISLTGIGRGLGDLGIRYVTFIVKNILCCFVGLWDNFLEMRIQLQKALLIANRLPQQEQLASFNSSGDKNLKETYKQGTCVQYIVFVIAQIMFTY